MRILPRQPQGLKRLRWPPEQTKLLPFEQLAIILVVVAVVFSIYVAVTL